MITTADFKKQIAKPFEHEMRQHGFHGSGFEYFQDTDNYLIAVYISPGKWGGSCFAGFAIHPKQIDKDSNGKKDLTKLKIARYQFRFGLIEHARGAEWSYSDSMEANLATLSEIIDTIKVKAFPVIDKFKATPNILDEFDISEMDQFHTNWTNKTGVSIATTDTRFGWAMTILFENKNLKKAKEFASWTLSHRDNDIKWFGDEVANFSWGGKQ